MLDAPPCTPIDTLPIRWFARNDTAPPQSQMLVPSAYLVMEEIIAKPGAFAEWHLRPFRRRSSPPPEEPVTQ